jgi:hypothetical protein
MASKKAGLPIKQAQGSGKVDKPIPVQIVDTMSPRVSQKSDSEYAERERKYRAEDALRVISQAEEHKKDRDLMKDVKSLAREKMKSMQKAKLC